MWKDIPGWEGYYKISKKGQVRSLPRIKKGRNDLTYKTEGKLISHYQHPNGYVYVNLRVPGRSRYSLVHRLLALTFIPNPHSKSEINHKNGIKNDNRLSNLEWVTRSEQIKHAFKNGLSKPNYSMKGKFGKNHHSSRTIMQLDKNLRIVQVFESMGEAYRATGVCSGEISRVCNGERLSAGGFIWRFVVKSDSPPELSSDGHSSS